MRAFWGKETPTEIETAPPEEPLPPLSAYEVRKQDIQDSGEQIEGIFYIYDGRIIPDYYSECLISDTHSPYRKAMYHLKFFPNYMRRKYDGLGYSEKSVSRGRIFRNVIYIDYCYADNTELLYTLRELYRLPPKMSVGTTEDYRCPNCLTDEKKSVIVEI